MQIRNPKFKIQNMTDGILIIDKPVDWTSHDVVGKLRRILKTKRVGHTGTLDPFATGVLVMLVGNGTRLAQFLDKDAKEYEATIRFGFETDTGDLTGTPKTEIQITEPFSEDELKKTFSNFIGYIFQTPPMYSAKKIQGKKLYELARQGIEIERKSVRVAIHGLEFLLNEKGGLYVLHDDSTFDLKIRVSCEAGTYIRTLAEDIGKKLGTGAHLSALRRIHAGKFDLAKAVTIEQLEEIVSDGKLSDYLISMNQGISHLPARRLDDTEITHIKHGRKVPAKFEQKNVQTVRLTDASENLLAIGNYNQDEETIQPRIVFIN